MSYINGKIIKELREGKSLTQKQLGEIISVSDKTISKWETEKGLPDITLLEPLSKALGVSVAELLSGESIVNQNRAGNIRKTKFYVCPVCGNVVLKILFRQCIDIIKYLTRVLLYNIPFLRFPSKTQ